jgi:hypothetical protein
MSLTLTSDTKNEEGRFYDRTNDRLFLVYYALPSGFNANKWGVSPTSLDANIQTAVNKPVVVYRRNPNNRYHTHQAGNFVHPTLEEAAEELGHPPNAEEYFNWQEKFAVGRVRNVDKRGEKGYAFTLEITDQNAKNILKSDAYRSGIPGWTSPQILSDARRFPQEERDNIFDHWVVSHIALVDVPAYGYEQAGVRGKCLGAEQECMIKTKSASEENLGFCVKQATIDLIDSRSSLSSRNATSSHTSMSESQNTTGTPVSGQNVTFTPAPPQVSTTDNTQPIKAETSQSAEPANPENDKVPAGEETERLATNEPQSLQEAQVMVRQMSELLKETNKQLKTQGKELDTIKQERKQARLAFIIPRDLFKSDESHMKEVQKTMNENISEQWLTEYWKTKRELAMAQGSAKRMIGEEPLVAKSASSVQNGHDVPDFSSSQSPNRTSNVQKTLELQRMILEGGGS